MIGEVGYILGSSKALVVVGVLPIFALIPDITYVVFQKVIYPTPTDWVLNKQRQDPTARFEGFDDVYAAYMPEASLGMRPSGPGAVHALDDSEDSALEMVPSKFKKSTTQNNRVTGNAATIDPPSELSESVSSYASEEEEEFELSEINDKTKKS